MKIKRPQKPTTGATESYYTAPAILKFVSCPFVQLCRDADTYLCHQCANNENVKGSYFRPIPCPNPFWPPKIRPFCDNS